jgi:hypothetical protein
MKKIFIYLFIAIACVLNAQSDEYVYFSSDQRTIDILAQKETAITFIFEDQVLGGTGFNFVPQENISGDFEFVEYVYSISGNYLFITPLEGHKARNFNVILKGGGVFVLNFQPVKSGGFKGVQIGGEKPESDAVNTPSMMQIPEHRPKVMSIKKKLPKPAKPDTVEVLTDKLKKLSDEANIIKVMSVEDLQMYHDIRGDYIQFSVLKDEYENFGILDENHNSISIIKINYNVFLRDPDDDIFMIHFTVTNLQDTDLEIEKSETYIRAGSHVYKAQFLDMPERIEARSSVDCVIAIKGTGDGKRNDLSVDGDYRVLIKVFK